MEKIKSLADLKKKREELQSKIELREGGENVENLVQVKVAMATCGIAAGARPVLNAFVEGVNKENLEDKVSVTQTGCIGICQFEPVVEVFEAGKEKVTYVKMTPEKADEVIQKHLKGGQIVGDYTIGAISA